MDYNKNTKKAFEVYLLNNILHNLPSYKRWIKDLISWLDKLEYIFVNSFKCNPFEFDSTNIDVLKEYLKQKSGTLFESYNLANGNGIPNAILNKHFVNFIKGHIPFAKPLNKA